MTASLTRLRRRGEDTAPASAPPAPALMPDGTWWNTEPVTLENLRGTVVLVNFWVHSCVNCHNSLPTLRAWRDRYRARGFEIVGVHTPEVGSDRDPQGLEAALLRDGVTWPVMQDNALRTWRAYGVRAWPTFYLLDRAGRVRFAQEGELSSRFPDGIAPLEARIGALLGEPAPDREAT